MPIESNRNVASKLLTHENEQLFSHLGQKRSTLATTVAQVHLFKNDKWQKLCCGVLAFVKDYDLRSYFIRVFDATSGSILQVYEQEIYREFKYSTDKPFFHTFDGEHCVVGLNFADEAEAKQFARAVDRKLNEKDQRRSSKVIGSAPCSAAPPLLLQPPDNRAVTKPTQGSTSPAVAKSQPSFASSAKKKTPRKLTAADISTPTNFRQVAHVGLDMKTGKLDSFGTVPGEFGQLFNDIGIDLANENSETVRQVCETIAAFGGVNAVREAVAAAAAAAKSEQPVAVTTPSLPPSQSALLQQPAQPAPGRQPPKLAPPLPPTRPPPPRTTKPTLPNITPAPAPAPPAPPGPIPPPPPPPPPPPSTLSLPIPPPAPNAPNLTQQLLNIPKPSEPSPKPAPATTGGMSTMLDEITKFKTSGLKPVSERPVNPNPKQSAVSASHNSEQPTDVVLALRNYLESIRPVVRPSSSSEDESSDSGDEWAP